MRLRRLSCVFWACLAGYANASVGLVSGTGVSGATPYTEKGASYQFVPAQGVRVQLAQNLSAFGLNLGNANWSQYTHVLLTLTNNQPKPVLTELVIDSGTSGWAWSDVVLGANATETVAVPLSNSHTNGWTGSPSIDGSTAQSSTSGTVVQDSIRRIRLWNVQRAGALDITIGQLTAVTYAPRLTALIDAYGQQTVGFAGKVTADSQLVAQATAEANLPGALPYSSDPFGGVAGSGLDSGTGRWRTAKQNGKWYIITPSGNRFFSTGVLYVGTGTYAYTQDRTALFAAGALPSQTGPFKDHYETAVSPITGQQTTGFDFYTANLQRKFGSDWVNLAMANNARRMKAWGFNTVGPVSHWTMYQPSLQLANMQQTVISGNYRTIDCPGGAPMPDAFDPAWAAAVSSTLTPLVPALNQNQYNAGLFVDNELPWAQHPAATNYRYDFAFNVLSAPANQPAKLRFYNTLLMQYRTIQKLNGAWGTNFATWNALLANRNFRPSTVGLLLGRDLQAFQTTFASQYFSTIRNKLSGLGYKGLYLGCRFYFYSPETVAAAARYCDVLSFNAYDITPSQWRSDLKSVDKPVLVSEFAFSGADDGRVGAGFPVCPSETTRAQAYQQYVEDAKTWPNLVGLHWYKWDDDPVTGRMWDNANHTYGLVSVTDEPYQTLIDAMTLENTQLNQRLLTP